MLPSAGIVFSVKESGGRIVERERRDYRYYWVGWSRDDFSELVPNVCFLKEEIVLQ